MIIFLYGQDTYRLREKLNEIIDNYKKIHKSGLNLKCYDLKKDDSEGFFDEFQQTSMFWEKKLAIIKNAFSDAAFKNKFVKNEKLFLGPEDIILFFEEDAIPAKDSFFQFLKKNGRAQEFGYLDRNGLKKWIQEEFERYSMRIDFRAQDILVDFIGNNLWQLSGEIKKLVSFKREGKIEAKDVEVLVKPKIEADIFQTIDAIAAKNKKRALSLIYKHLEMGDSPLYLWSMIHYQFRNLLIIRDLIEQKKPYGAILSISKLHPFVVKKSCALAQKFTLSQLKKIYQKIFQADADIKTGKIEPETALDVFIAEV